MTPQDERYLQRVLSERVLEGPCLELGAGIPEHSARRHVEAAGLDYVSTDVAGNVDVVADFAAEGDAVLEAFRTAGYPVFASALVMNVLEHTFDPIRVLDNVFALLRPGGTCLVVTPSVWPIHSFPLDCWRVLPDFYEEYARRRGHTLVEGTFEFVGRGPVRGADEDETRLPLPGSKWHLLYSRAIHKLFNTVGRGMVMPSHVATAVVLRAGADET